MHSDDTREHPHHHTHAGPRIINNNVCVSKQKRETRREGSRPVTKEKRVTTRRQVWAHIKEKKQRQRKKNLRTSTRPPPPPTRPREVPLYFNWAALGSALLYAGAGVGAGAEVGCAPVPADEDSPPSDPNPGLVVSVLVPVSADALAWAAALSVPVSGLRSRGMGAWLQGRGEASVREETKDGKA